MNVGIYNWSNTNRHLTPDSIVPNPVNPQSLNRYSYVLNSPLNFTDPTGHNPICNYDRTICSDGAYDDGTQPGDLGLAAPQPEVYTWNVLGLDLLNFNVVILPLGTPLNAGHASEKWLVGNNENAAELISTISQELAATLDFVEMVLIFMNPPLAQAIGVLDMLPTLMSCYYGSECYYGRPHEALPEMYVINQDVLVTAIDGFLIRGPSGRFRIDGTVVNEHDFVATFASYILDIFDIGGIIPNALSVGVNYSPETGIGIYLLLYPDLTRK